MSDLAALEALLNNERALRLAQRAQNVALSRQDLATKPLANFNSSYPNLNSGLATRIDELAALERLRQSGAIRPPTTPTPPSATAAPTATATAPPINAPARVPVPVTGGSYLGGIGAGLGIASLLPTLSTALQNVATGAGNIGSLLAGDGTTRALQPYTADPVVDFQRRFNDGQRRLFGNDADVPFGSPAANPPRNSPSGAGFGAGLMCQLFGISCPVTNPEGVPNLGSPGADPPFYGGQSPGVSYHYRLDWENDTNVFVPDWQPNYFDSQASQSFPVVGPIHGTYQEFSGGTNDVIGVLHGTPPQKRMVFSIARSGKPQPLIRNVRLSNLRRADGQPDTGGNPAPLPGTAPRPATTPALAPVPQPRIYPSNQPDSPIAPANLVPNLAPNPATTPITTSPTAPPDTTTPPQAPPDSPPDSPFRPGNLVPFLPLLAIPFLIPSIGRVFNPSGARQISSGPISGTSTPPTSLSCSYDSAGIAGKVDQANLTLNVVNNLLEQQVLSKLATIDAKLGAQIPGGGISGQLGKMFDFAKKTWNFLQIDRVLNILTYITVLHNAYMLSNNLGQTLFSAIGVVLNVFGIEDADGGELPVAEIVGKWTEDFFKSLIGEERVEGIKTTWAKYNRIYQAATNIIYSVQSMVYSMVEILEIISNYTGRIGNALLRSGTVLANSFNWMTPNINYTDSRFFRFMQRIQDGVELVETVFSEVLNIQEEGGELFNKGEKIREEFGKEEKAVEETESKARSEQKRPDTVINPDDEKPKELENQ